MVKADGVVNRGCQEPMHFLFSVCHLPYYHIVNHMLSTSWSQTGTGLLGTKAVALVGMRMMKGGWL